MFDIDKLTAFAVAEISKFAADHQNETFYAFAIDANLLCLNSIEQFEASLTYHRERWDASNKSLEIAGLSENELLQFQREVAENIEYANSGEHEGLPLTLEDLIRQENDLRSANRQRGNPYLSQQEMRELRENTGDWHYQGFSSMESEHGFDAEAYAKHYEMSDRKQKSSSYAKAMDALLKRIHSSGVLLQIKRTEDFQISRVEHNY